MIVKVFGCLVIMVCATLAGFVLANGYKKRVRELRAFQQALQMLESEILYTSTPLPQAVDRTARSLAAPVNRIFAVVGKVLDSRTGCTAGEAWCMGVDQTKDLLSLDSEDIEIIRSFGKNLGSVDKENQEKSFTLAKYQLRAQQAKAEEERSKNERLYKNLGFLLGAALVILLI
jgi:stage III sporulation protein AB